MDEVNSLKLRCEQWQPPPSTSSDPHTSASLLRLWFRELAEPLIPPNMYLTAVTHSDEEDVCVALVSQLPELNQRVLIYLIHLLQVLVCYSL